MEYSKATGEHFSYNVNDGTSLDEINASVIHDRSAPGLEPLSRPMSTAFEGFINGVNVTRTFQSLKMKSSSGHGGLSNLALKYAARAISAVFTYLFQLSLKVLESLVLNTIASDQATNANLRIKENAAL